MTELKIAYFDQLGQKELKQAQVKFLQKYPTYSVKLSSTGHQEGLNKIKTGQVDLLISDLRDEKNDLTQVKLVKLGLMALLPKDSYPAGLQMIEKDQLVDLTCFVVASPAEEKTELHLFRDLLKIKSPLMAANSVEEAALLAASGSGYFLINERAANLLQADDLQKLFLLDHGRQLEQKVTAFYQQASPALTAFIKLLQAEY